MSLVTFATGMDLPTGMAFDSQGNLYVCNITTAAVGYVDKITPGGIVSKFASGLNYPTDIAIQTPEPPAMSLILLAGLFLARPSRLIQRCASGPGESKLQDN